MGQSGSKAWQSRPHHPASSSQAHSNPPLTPLSNLYAHFPNKQESPILSPQKTAFYFPHATQHKTTAMSTSPPPTTTTTTSPSPSPSNPFPFPPEYSFPPFFTRQTNLTTHHAQLIKWSSLVLAYCRHHRLFKLSLSGQPTTTTTTITNPSSPSTEAAGVALDTTELFHNKRINRRLALPDIRAVIDFLRKDGRAEYVSSSSAPSSSSAAEGGGGGGAGGGDIAWIYWRTPEEWAALVEEWVDATGQKGSVLTVYELVEGDGTVGAGTFLSVYLHLPFLVILIVFVFFV